MTRYIIATIIGIIVFGLIIGTIIYEIKLERRK